MAETSRLNILLIIADQYRFDCLSALDHSVVRTPNLDRLAADGALFTSAHCAAMACGPARASIFTGLFADEHGMHNNRDSLVPEDRPVLPEHLRDAGYDTALVGKLHLKPFGRRFGFRYFVRHDAPYTNYLADEAYDSAYVRYLADMLFGGNIEEPIRRFTEDEACLETDEERFILGTDIAREPEHHEAAWAVREALRYLRDRRDKARPFFLNIGLYGPHQPYLCPEPWGLSRYPPDSIPLPDDFYHETEDKPVLVQSGRLKRVQRRLARGWTEDNYRRLLSAYYGYVAWIDDRLGLLFDALQAEGLYDNTLIVFTADHGDLGGQYRLIYKGPSHEGSTHVPLIVRDPRSDLRGTRIDREVSNMDVFSTCLSAARVPAPVGITSRDLLPLLAGESGDWDNRSLFKCGNESCIVRDGVKLIRGDYGGKSYYELYDLKTDPMESRNRLDDPLCATTSVSLRAELDPWHDGMDENATSAGA